MNLDAPDAIRHIIVDTDTGIDDALALLYLAGHPHAEISAITSVFGNTSVDSALTNIARVLSVAELEDTLVARGAAGPIVGTSRLASHVHGEDGLGDLWSTPLRPKNMSPLSSAELIVQMARARPGYYDLLPLGPFSNVALALEIEPDLLTLFRSVVVMGGSGAYPAPGTMLMVDANVHSDGVAAERMFAAPRRALVMVGVDVTARAIVDEQGVLALRRSGTPWGTFSADVLDAYMDFTQYTWGRRISAAHDGLAAALLMHPEWITRSADGPVNVTRDGFATRAFLMRTSDGMPVCWPARPAPDTHVVLDVDYSAFLADFLRILSRTP
ncbi:nucleoside hydrolase [Glaciibacter psychrotolerans]|uniref:Purine nucleosidase n=1 Tax=Glaciibacter psychrotolerans TaxID=670054 RepID=A0A7Z0EH29_9MICO|nr:nucleoside hydrolase [Leifsonia psychrotolerans]NYJ20777.1 purine nucleosidase [Leifsonia psychrotolerans]